MEDMVGKWKLDQRDPNFDEFLQCRQVISKAGLAKGYLPGRRLEASYSDL